MNLRRCLVLCGGVLVLAAATEAKQRSNSFQGRPPTPAALAARLVAPAAAPGSHAAAIIIGRSSRRAVWADQPAAVDADEVLNVSAEPMGGPPPADSTAAGGERCEVRRRVPQLSLLFGLNIFL